MVKLIMGFFAAILIIALGLGAIWGLDRLGIVNANNLILQIVSYYPGLKDLNTTYELGKRQSDVLVQRLDELHKLDQKLKMEGTKLNKEQAAFEKSKLDWEKQHLPTPNLAATGNQAAGKQATGNQPGRNQPTGNQTPQNQQPSITPSQVELLTKEEDKKVKSYLALIGAMKPEQAAQVIQKLPENISFLVFEQTSDRQVTKIMELLPPEYLAALTKDRVNKLR